MEEFVQSSGENGIVVFSLGSIVINLTEERTNTIASALTQIPQKVDKNNLIVDNDLMSMLISIKGLFTEIFCKKYKVLW